jgi:hypothetical protein
MLVDRTAAPVSSLSVGDSTSELDVSTRQRMGTGMGKICLSYRNTREC